MQTDSAHSKSVRGERVVHLSKQTAECRPQTIPGRFRSRRHHCLAVVRGGARPPRSVVIQHAALHHRVQLLGLHLSLVLQPLQVRGR